MTKRRTTTASAVLLALLAAGACRPASDYVTAPPVERAPSAFSTARYTLGTASLGVMGVGDALDVPATANVAPEPLDVVSTVALIDPITVAPPLCGEACGEAPTGAIAEGPTWEIGTAVPDIADTADVEQIDSGDAVEAPPVAPVSATPWLVSCSGGPGPLAAFLTIPMSANGVETWLNGDPARRAWCAPILNTFA